MAYYILAKYVNAGMKIDKLPPEFFEYIFLNNGDAANVAPCYGDASGHYQADSRRLCLLVSGGPAHIRQGPVANHLLFFLYHHVAIFPEELWPKAIAVNGFVSLEGQKMSKSKGPLLTLVRPWQRTGRM